MSFPAPVAHSKSSLSLYQPKSSIVTADDVSTLAHCFHRNPKASVCYQNEARATLAKLSDPVVRLALDSLSALRNELGLRRRAPVMDGRSAALGTERSLEAYSAAVSGLAFRLREQPGRTSARDALVCCQMFISIEIMLCDYHNAIQHFILGLRIMYQYRSRSGVSNNGRLVPRHSPDLPLLDAFAIKLFESGYPGPRHMSSCQRAHVGPLQTTANVVLCDQARSDLSALSARVLQFLSRVTEPQSRDQLVELKIIEVQILHSLQSWEQAYASTIREAMEAITSTRVRFGAAFSLLLHLVLKVVVSLAMSAPIADADSLERDFQALSKIASFITETRKGAEIRRAQRE